MRKAYILSSYKVSKTTYQFIHAKLQGLDSEQRRFFLHILCSHLIDLTREKHDALPGWDVLGVKIPFKTIKAEFARGFRWTPLQKSGLIEASDFARGECRYFQVTPAILDEILEHLRQQTVAPDGSPAVNLFDGNAYSVTESALGNGSQPSSTLMRDAVRILSATECPVNRTAVQDHLDRLRGENKVLALRNDELCAQSMFAGMRLENTIGYYFPSYSMLKTGRIGEKGGGLQSCSRKMKEAAFSGIGDVRNYDLRSSQGYVLLQELRLADIDGSWLVAHLGPGVFEKWASALGLPKKVYKKCFFATIMGASHRWLDGEHIGAIQGASLECFGDRPEARAKFDQVVAQLAPLKRLVGLWAEWLLNSTSCPHRKRSQRREYLQNAVGQKLVLDRSRPLKELKGEAAAHILQGQEAAYIHHLTLLSKPFGFVPVSNQHDGLVTVGEVPAEAQAEASRLSGFCDAYLEVKPFA